MNIASTRTVFFILFAISGFSGLIYESIWTHYLKLFLGHAAYAQTLVLAIFMGGMAIGAGLCGRFSLRWPNLLRGYAIAEGSIGIAALVFHEVFDGSIQLAYNSIMPALHAPWSVSVFKWSLASLFILPQSILLGMTFPLMSAGLLRRYPLNPGQTLAMLYFSNSIGAAVGVLASGFVLINLVGLPGTIRIAGLLNILLAATVWVLARQQQEMVPQAALTTDRTASSYRLFLLIALLTGLASFIYEIAWIRMLSLVLGSSTHAFELMLSAFIFGIALGGLWIRQRIEQIANSVRYLAMIQLIMGLLALSTLPLYNVTFSAMQWLVENLAKDASGYAWFNVTSHIIAMAIMLPTTFCAGMTLPLITHTLLKQDCGERSIGSVYSANTVGAILGVFFAVHLGMPLLGLKNLLWVGAAIDIALAWVLLFNAKERGAVLKAALASGVIGLGSILIFAELDTYKMSSGVYRLGTLINPNDTQILYHKDGKAATVDLLLTDQVMSIHTNGKTDAAINMAKAGDITVDEPTMILAAALPLAFNPQATQAAVIGMGSGLSTHTLLGSDTLQTVDTIEIETAMVEAARKFSPRNERTYSDSRSHIYIDDAKTYFSTHNKRYDIILSEPSNPWVSGTASLFTEEFYRLLPNYLSSNGVLVQWVQLYELDVGLVATILKALTQHFDDYAIYTATDRDLLIIAKPHGLLPTTSDAIFRMPRLNQELHSVQINHPGDIAIRRLGSKAVFDPLFASYSLSPNSDYYPVLDLGAAKTRFLQARADELSKMAYKGIPVARLLDKQTGIGLSAIATDTRNPIKALFAYISSGIRDLYFTGQIQIDPQRFPSKYRTTVSQIQGIFKQCQPAQAAQWINTLLDFYLGTAAFLSEQDLDRIWRDLQSGDCFQHLSPMQQDWIVLLHKLSLRDGQGSAGIASHLLRNGVATDQAQMRFLLIAAMTGEILSGRQQQALALWQTYSKNLQVDLEDDLNLRLLVAHSNGGRIP